MERLLLNGNPKVTLIERFDGSAVILGPKAGEKVELPSLLEAKCLIEFQDWEVNIAFIKGSPIKRGMVNGDAGIQACKEA